jgi:hypothetical protein
VRAAPRIAFFAWALVICPLLMVSLIEIIDDEVEDDTHAWLLIVGIPALLTITLGVLGHRSRVEIVLAAFLSAGLSGLTVLLFILYAFGVFK